MAQSELQTATQAGQSLEDRIEADLAQAGFEIIKARDWQDAQSSARIEDEEHPHYAILDARYRSIYGHDGKIDFLVIHDERRILVDARHQSVPGSVDEKLPYVYLNALENLVDHEFVLIVEGDGFRPGALDWVRRKAGQTEGFYVLSPPGFIDWLKRNSKSSQRGALDH